MGIIIGAFGTLIGAGGGFVLVPLLLLFYPAENPDTITSISLAVVFFNALSGSLAYAWAKRIDYRSGLLCAAATIPGAVLGALTTTQIPRRTFDLLFGILMVAASALLCFSPKRNPKNQNTATALDKAPTGRATGRYFFGNNRLWGAGLSVLFGYISSLLGIGAGFLYVPTFIYFLDFPVHVATATSQFILAIMAFAGSATHVVTGAFHNGVRRTLVLSVGVVVGAQLGARLSSRVQGDWIMRGLAVALGFVGVRLIIMAL